MLSFFFGVSNQRQFMKTFVLFYCQPRLRWVEQGEREKESERERERDRCIILPCCCCCCIPVVRSPLLCYTHSPALAPFSAPCALSPSLRVCVLVCLCARTHDLFLALTHTRTVVALQLHSCLSSSSASLLLLLFQFLLPLLLLFLLLCCCFVRFGFSSSPSCVCVRELRNIYKPNAAESGSESPEIERASIPLPCGYCCSLIVMSLSFSLLLFTFHCFTHHA